MAYSLAAAAEACSINRSTVLRAVKSGRISGTRDALGAWHVEPAELHRVFPPKAVLEAVPQYAHRDADLRARLAVADERLGELKALLEDMRGERDAWREQAQRLALTDATARRPWWRRWAAG